MGLATEDWVHPPAESLAEATGMSGGRQTSFRDTGSSQCPKGKREQKLLGKWGVEGREVSSFQWDSGQWRGSS